MHAMSANAGGQIGSVIAAAVMLSVSKAWASSADKRKLMAQTREELEKKLSGWNKLPSMPTRRLPPNSTPKASLPPASASTSCSIPALSSKSSCSRKPTASTSAWLKNLPSDDRTGFGKIDGRPVYVYSQDRAILAGASAAPMRRKSPT